MFILQNPRTAHVQEWAPSSCLCDLWASAQHPCFGKTTEEGPAPELPSSLALLGSDIRLTKEGNFPGWCADWPEKVGNSLGKEQFCFVPFSLVPESWMLSCDWVSCHLWCLREMTWLLCVVLGPRGFKSKVGVGVETLDCGWNNFNTSVRYWNPRSDLIFVVSRKCVVWCGMAWFLLFVWLVLVCFFFTNAVYGTCVRTW